MGSICAEEERATPLTLAERATLAGWVLTFKKYEVVGKLEGHEEQSCGAWQ